MANWPKDYIEYVLDDIKRYDGNRKIKKAGLIERCMQRYCAPKILHPNPDDEFSHDDVGPNFGIINNYMSEIKIADALELPIFKEPLIVEKMETDGYLLLNGHHRWFAAMRMGIKKIHIQIVNLVHEEDVCRMLEKNNNTKRAAFDLDEVLLTTDSDSEAALADSLFCRKIKDRLRKGAPEVIKALQKNGYDVWIYTAGYKSVEDINDFFSMYEITIDGIANGVNDKRVINKEEVKRIKEMMADKYKSTVHIDNETVLLTHSSDKDFEQYAIFEKNADWAQGIVEIVESEGL